MRFYKNRRRQPIAGKITEEITRKKSLRKSYVIKNHLQANFLTKSSLKLYEDLARKKLLVISSQSTRYILTIKLKKLKKLITKT